MSQKCEYGLRILLELTKHRGGPPVSVKQIASAQAIPQRFLELIIRDLRQAGLVASHRGAKGGYTLAADPAQLTVANVIRLLDGPPGPMDCMSCGGPRYCPLQKHCAWSDLWNAAAAALAELYESATFADLARREAPP
ncbi:MAG: Rrf2 family transcriptional regulator [Planctomycetes bacterium]|nr:Rrf2 family transcriptional regulator [Planctomycetota bacterium]